MAIIDKIKNIINKNSIDNSQEGRVSLDDFMLNNLSFGDVILAKRYDTETQRESFKEGHDIGLYVVVDKEDNRLICCYCTSVEGKKGFFQLGEDYRIFNNKKTFVTVSRIKAITDFSFMKKVGTLNVEDKEKLIKNLKFHNSFYYENGDRKKINVRTYDYC